MLSSLRPSVVAVVILVVAAVAAAFLKLCRGHQHGPTQKYLLNKTTIVTTVSAKDEQALDASDPIVVLVSRYISSLPSIPKPVVCLIPVCQYAT